MAEAVYLANPSPMLSHEPGGWPPARNSSREGGQARTPPDPPPCIEGGEKTGTGQSTALGGGPLLSRHRGRDRTPGQDPVGGGHPAGPSCPPWQAGSPGIPRRCRQLAALLLFSRCWLQPLRHCQPLAFPTCPLPPPRPSQPCHGQTQTASAKTPGAPRARAAQTGAPRDPRARRIPAAALPLHMARGWGGRLGTSTLLGPTGLQGMGVLSGCDGDAWWHAPWCSLVALCRGKGWVAPPGSPLGLVLCAQGQEGPGTAPSTSPRGHPAP